jgi:HK97 family phage portal protein
MPSPTLRDRFAVAAKAVAGIFSEQSLAQTQGLLTGIFPGVSGDPPHRGDRNVLNAYNDMPWLRAVAQRVATSVASSATDWRLYAPVSRQLRDVRKFQRCGDKALRGRMIKEADDTLQPIDNHVLLDALNNANSFMVGQALFKTTQIHLDLVGEAFWLKERNKLGTPVGFWPLPSDWVTATPTPSTGTYRVSFKGWQGQIPDSEILWMTEPDPTNPYGRGSGMGRALSDELETDEYAAKHTRQLFFNRARPDMIVWPKNTGPHDPGLDQGQVRRLEERWLDGHQGFWRAFKPFFVGREIGVHEVSQNLRELQMVELRQQQRDIVVQMFGIPPEMLGILSSSNRATIEAADYLFSRWVVQPRLEFLRAQLQERLVPEYDERLIIDYVSPVQEDRDFMLKSAQAAPYAMTVDEWRTLQGQEPLPDELGQVHMIPNNLVTARTPYVVPAPVPAMPAEAPLEGPEIDTELEIDQDIEIEESRAWQATLKALRDAGDGVSIYQVQSYLHQKDYDTDAVDEVGGLTERLMDQEPATFRMLRKHLFALNGRATNENILDAIQQSLTVDAVFDVVGMKDWMTDLKGDMSSKYLKAFKTGAELAADLVNINLVKQDAIRPPDPDISWFNQVNQLAVAWAEKHGGIFINEITESSRQGIQRVISQSLREGWDTRRTARRIRAMVGLTARHAGVIDNFANRLADENLTDEQWQRRIDNHSKAQLRTRAAVIARTELSFAGNEGQDELWMIAREEGVLDTDFLRRKLVTARGFECPICKKIGDETKKNPIEFTAVFSNGKRNPPMHPNCVCRVVLVEDPDFK